MKPDELVLAVRAYTVRQDQRPKRRAQPSKPVTQWPRSVLVFDTETTVDAAQQLLFGGYRYGRWTPSGDLVCVREGLFYADGLPRLDPEGYRRLVTYAKTHHASVASGADSQLHLHARAAFVEEVLWPALKAGAAIVGFNLPFDLSRLAAHCGEARGPFRGGFSLRLWDNPSGRQREHPYRPRICITQLDSRRSFIGLTRRSKADATDGVLGRGRFLDLRTLAFALTDKSYSLEGACDAFNVEHRKSCAPPHGRITAAYIGYNRRDVLATAELLVRLRQEFDRHPVELDPCKAYSPASMAKAYLRQMHAALPAQQFRSVPPRVLGRTMAAYYGGRAECRIRRIAVPVVYLDFLSMYPTVHTLLGLWRTLTAESLQVVDAATEVRALVASVSVQTCFEPAFWAKLDFFAEVEPDGNILPTRARYTDGSDTFTIGVNPLSSATPLWYAGPDLVASTLLSGKAPTVRRAFRMVPHGRQAELQPVHLRGEVAIDPRMVDFFQAVIEERSRISQASLRSPADRERLSLFLKILANSGAYGVFAEMNREELPAKRRKDVLVYGLGKRFRCPTHAPEELGRYGFPPLAALITAGARLMLALLERCVTDRGGAYAFCDTDSMAVVATADGGLVPCPDGTELRPEGGLALRALSWGEVDAIVARFATLNPYHRGAVPGSVLKVEAENFTSGERRQLYAYAISAKRYALFTIDEEGRITVVKASEHGLGHLLNPTSPDDPSRDWITKVWELIIGRASGLPCEEPVWLDRPVIARVTISAPELLRPFRRRGEHASYAEGVKPMNFLLSAQVTRLGHPPGVDPKHFHLMAPYTPDPRQWMKIAWTDIHSRNEYRVTTSGLGYGMVVRVKSYGAVLAEYEVHPEPKSAALSREPCGPGTRGLLRRRLVRARSIVHIGKEANRLDAVDAQWLHDLDELIAIYEDRRV